MTNQTEITLSDNAKLHIAKVLEKEPDGLGLRLAVKTTGCSGNQYVIETAKSINEEDKTMEFEGIKIIVDKNISGVIFSIINLYGGVFTSKAVDLYFD